MAHIPYGPGLKYLATRVLTSIPSLLYLLFRAREEHYPITGIDILPLDIHDYF